jgi:hypothetical protein
METPALALYRQFCKDAPCTDLPADAEAAAQLQPIAVQWCLKLAPEQAKVADIRHCAPPRNFVIDWVAQFFQAVFWKLDDSAQARCPFSLTLSASDLEVSSPEDQALVAGLLRDRLVMVGASITSTGDLVQSPVHGLIPGVYLHAMALDNLIYKGMDYDREPANFPGLNLHWVDLLELGLLALILVLKALHARRLAGLPAWTRWPAQEDRFFTTPYWSWGLVMLMLLAVCGVLYLNHITLVNVLGIVLLSLALFSERIEAFFDRVR